MKQGVFAIRDEVAEVFSFSHTAVNNAVAQRDFVSLCSSSGSPLYANRRDLVLYRIGTFDDATGEIADSTPTLITRYKEYDENA